MTVRAPFKPPRPLNPSSLEPGKSSQTTAGPRNPHPPPKPSAQPKRTAPKLSEPLLQPNPKRTASHSSSSTLPPPTTTDGTTSGSSTSRYIVQWRKVTNKKNKTWDGDGVIIVKNLVITAKIDNKVLTKSIPSIDGIFKIGGYELEVDCADDGPGNESPVTSQTKAPKIPDQRSQIPKQAPKPVTKPPSSVPVFKSLMPNNPGSRLPKKDIYPKTDTSFVMNKAAESDSDVIIDPNLDKVLRPHQREGISFLYDVIMGHRFDGTGALLADEMGLGKTLMTITLIWTLLKQSPNKSQTNSINKVLIVCPVTLINNWKREFKKWLNLNQIGVLAIDSNCTDYKHQIRSFAKTKVYQVLIMSYEKLLNCEEELSSLSLDLLVCDEGHKLKNNANKGLKILSNLDIERKILLTGTPIQNNLNEFFTLINFLNKGVLGTFNEFQRKFIKPIESYRDPNCYNQEVIDLGRQASQALNELTSKFILRRTNELLSRYLGSKTDVLLFVKPTALQLKMFKQVFSGMNKHSNDLVLETLPDRDNALNLINLFKKICNSPLLAKDDNLFNSLVDSPDSVLTVSSGKLNLLTLLVVEIIKVKKEKVVIISNYTKTLDVIQQVLQQLNFEFLRLDGSTNSNTRTSLINQFNSLPFPKCPIFLLSSKSGGFGINLIGASRLIMVDNDWNPSNDLQAMSRIYRDGQEKPVFIYRLFTTGCIDEKIFQRQLMKTNLSDNFLNSGAKDDNLNIFDAQDLKDLFTIHEMTDCNTHDLLECECNGNGEFTLSQVADETPLEASSSEASNGERDSQRDSLRSGGWISALNYSQMDQTELNARKSIRKALNDYHHIDPQETVDCSDDVLVNILKSKANGISYIFTKVSNAGLDRELDSGLDSELDSGLDPESDPSPSNGV